MSRWSLQRLRSAFDCESDNSICRAVGARGIETFFETLSRVGRLHPYSRPERHGVEVIREVPYRSTGSQAHRLDVYVPHRKAPPRPVVLYVHGGGFRILSKETHWVFGLTFARAGYVVFQINYRLAPEHPFPEPLDDVCAAYRWVASNAGRYGGDAGRMVVAGESAGANLVTSLTLAATVERPEPFAREVFALDLVPRAVWPACGIHQVTDPERFWRGRELSQLVKDRIVAVCDGYVTAGSEDRDRMFFADPVVALESGVTLARPLPPFFLSAGTRDPIVEDTRRLEAVLRKLGATCEARYDAGEPHAYQAMLWKRSTRAMWRDTFQFLRRHV